MSLPPDIPSPTSPGSEPEAEPELITPDVTHGDATDPFALPPGGADPHTGGPANPLSWAAAPAGERARRRGRLRPVAALAVAAILGGGVVALGEQVFGPGGGGSSHLSISSQPNSPSVASSGINASAVAAKVEPAVVDVNSQVVGGGGVGTSEGTGQIVTSSGEVLTNNHVVAGATSVSVDVLAQHRSYPATVIAVDPTEDIALLQIQGAGKLPTVTFANPSSIKVGEPVVAIGNAYGLGGTPSVTSGTITGMNRQVTASDGSGSSEHLTGMLETNASLARGDSGGPLVDAAGHVVGMDTAANTSAFGQQASSSIAFAIPAGRLTSVVRTIKAGTASAKIVRTRTAFLGVDVVTNSSSGAAGIVPGYGEGFGPTPSTAPGALVVGVIPGTPAAQAGLQAGDVITQADGRRVTNQAALAAAIRAKRPGQQLTLGWRTGQATSQASVTLAEGPVA